MKRPHSALAVLAVAAILFTGACAVGPKYKKPNAPLTPTFKEPLPDGWKHAAPNDDEIKGKWWEMYNDPVLNALVEQIALSNQNVLAAEAAYREAKDAVRIARSFYFPTLTTSPAATRSLSPGGFTNIGGQSGGGYRSLYTWPASVSWQADVWGSIRRGVRSATAQAQASAADLANATLLFQSELAQAYFSLHGVDGDIYLLQRTVQAFEQFLQLTRDRFAAGVASDLDVALAESQLESARTQLIDLGVARAQFEHAIAVLAGKPPAKVNVTAMLLKCAPPPVPVTVPSVLLERRPDIAAGERLVAAANEQIGIAKAAYFPTVMFNGTAGFQSSLINTWLTWPSKFFAVGPTVSEIVYDGGRRRAQLRQFEAAYDATVAAYRQTVLTAFQQVEDALASERILAQESEAAARFVYASERELAISTSQYKAGTVDYLTVITAQTTLLTAQRTQVDLLTRRYLASVALVVSLGGGWDVSDLPTSHDVRSSSATPASGAARRAN
ncbi:MAG TPA: efflux transporter outer membrane subunit [Bryobacteraceae bacterium]|nr:efflux transporter outer membrane subunit [Bryobacteraceae bacterium]